jgi:ferrous iron transport protein A
MFLDELLVGEKAVIEDLCDDCTCIKLMEMGCLPGEIVCMKLKAPFRGPMAIEVGGSIISLRKAEARNIRVKKHVA